MIYLLQTSLYTAAMLLIYFMALRNKPLFALSRYYLIIAALLPLFVPLISLPDRVQQRLQKAIYFQFSLPAVTVSGSGVAQPVSGGFAAYAGLLYILVALALFLWQMSGIVRIWKIVRRSKGVAHKGYTVYADTGFGPGSFGKRIFFPEGEINKSVLAHELAHIGRYHSVDIVLICLLQSVFWPNIFLGLIKKELKEVHEFEADALAAADADEYAQLLLCSAFRTTSISIMHSFINHPLKRRIMMLKNKNIKATPLKAMLQVAASLCVVIALGAGVQSCKKHTASAPLSDKPLTNAVLKGEKQPYNDVVLTMADVMPHYKGDSLGSFLVHTLTYPDYARKNNIEGRVIVKFVVAKDGAVQNAKVLRSPDTSLTRAALAAINAMPAWEPAHMKDGTNVNVYFTLPVQFRLNN